jgi:hypothetical protein
MSQDPPWKARLDESVKPNERSYQARVEAVRQSTVPVALLPNEFRSHGADTALLRVGIMVGENEAGFLLVSGHRDGTLFIDKIKIDAELQLRGYGRDAMNLVRSIAQKEKYVRLAGKVEPGTPEVMRGRRLFAQKCGFEVNKDDTLKLEIMHGAP